VESPYKKEFPARIKAVLPTDIDLTHVEIWFQDETSIGQQEPQRPLKLSH
jgi:hypothetical protein